MSSEHSSGVDPTGLTAQKILRKIRGKRMCERDLFIGLRPMNRLALHRLLPAMVDAGRLAQYDEGTLPGPVVTMYCLPEERWF